MKPNETFSALDDHKLSKMFGDKPFEDCNSVENALQGGEIIAPDRFPSYLSGEGKDQKIKPVLGLKTNTIIDKFTGIE